jgi:hypothetical protein
MLRVIYDTKVIGPPFAENTATGVMYVDVLEEFLKSILKEECSNYMLLQEDGAPPFSHIREFLDRNFPLRLAKASLSLGLLVPLTSQHLILFCFFPPLPTPLPELAGRMRATTTTAIVTPALLTNLWTELNTDT